MNDRERAIKVVRQVLALEGDSAAWIHKSLRDELGASSLDLMTIVLDLQDEFDEEIPDQDLADIGSVEDILRYIEKKRANVA